MLAFHLRPSGSGPSARSPSPWQRVLRVARSAAEARRKERTKGLREITQRVSTLLDLVSVNTTQLRRMVQLIVQRLQRFHPLLRGIMVPRDRSAGATSPGSEDLVGREYELSRGSIQRTLRDPA
ncbi:MAG: hypothetical protein IT384_32455 [Deltaproteobacteria bacterium]|nr:hypothetical protein [Deltaproteobacteria bacterium]